MNPLPPVGATVMTIYQPDTESPFDESSFFSEASASSMHPNAQEQQQQMLEPSPNRRLNHELSSTYGAAEQPMQSNLQVPNPHYAMGYPEQPPTPNTRLNETSQHSFAPPPPPMDTQSIGPGGGYQPMPPPPPPPPPKQQPGWGYNYLIQETPLQSSLNCGSTIVAPSPLMAL